jgi:hypothetical protein
MKVRMMKAIAVLWLVSMLFFCACSSKRETQPGTASAPQTPEVETEGTSRERTITLTPRKEQPAVQAQTPRVVTESRPVMQSDQILSLRGGGIYGPEDYEIGELQGYSDDKNVRAILERIRAFVRGLEEGMVPVEDIHPDWKSQAQRSLTFHLERGNIPTDVRVGAIDLYAADLARANIRLIGEPGIALGEIYLRKMDNLWLVDDIQLDLAKLAEEPVERQEPYEPSVYRMSDMP